jgi:hypothetical protein
MFQYVRRAVFCPGAGAILLLLTYCLCITFSFGILFARRTGKGTTRELGVQTTPGFNTIEEATMKQLLNRFQQWTTAITFAEAGEWDTARRMSPAPARTQSHAINQFEQSFMAAAFAEAGLYDEAIRVSEGISYQVPATGDFLKSLGLSGVRVTYVVLAQ